MKVVHRWPRWRSRPTGPVLGDRARRNAVPELGELRSDDLLAPGRVLAPHLSNQRPEICDDRRTTWRATGAPAPRETPRRPVPADDGFRLHQQDGVEQASEAAGQGTEEPPIESAETRAPDPTTGHDELLPEEQILGDQSRARRYDGQHEIEHEAECEHGTA